MQPRRILSQEHEQNPYADLPQRWFGTTVLSSENGHFEQLRAVVVRDCCMREGWSSNTNGDAGSALLLTICVSVSGGGARCAVQLFERCFARIFCSGIEYCRKSWKYTELYAHPKQKNLPLENMLCFHFLALLHWIQIMCMFSNGGLNTL